MAGPTPAVLPTVVTVLVPTSPPPTAAPEPTRVARALPTVAAGGKGRAGTGGGLKVAELTLPTPATGGGGKRQFCVSLGASSFVQAKTKDFAPGFAVEGGPAERAMRPDSGKIQIEFDVDPPSPMEGEFFQVKASLVNRGMLDVRVTGVEENLPGSVTSFKRFTAFPYPPVVAVGQQEPVYAFQSEKLEGPFVKTIRVIERSGDYGTRTLELRPCQ